MNKSHKTTPQELLSDWQENLTDLYHEAGRKTKGALEDVSEGEDGQRAGNRPGNGRYIDETPLSSGGEKRIFTVYDQVTEREIAVARPLNKNNRAFLREARLTATLAHPSIVTIYDVHEEPDDVYFTMKLVRGSKLGEVCLKARQSEIKDHRAQLEIFTKVCDGVAYAHDQGIVHLDLKPSNVMVGQFGEAVILDWGLARRLDEVNEGPAVFGGTPGYMAPEQHVVAPRGKSPKSEASEESSSAQSGKSDQSVEARVPLDARTDVYSLGAILFFILHGKLPDEMSASRNQMVSVSDARDPLANLSQSLLRESLTRVAIKAMQSDPNERYATVLELKSDVQRYLDGYATKAENASYLTNLRYLYQRNQKFFHLGIATFLLLAGMTTYYFMKLGQREQRAIEAERKAGQAKQLAMIARVAAQRASQEADQARLQADKERKLADMSRQQAVTAQLQAEEAKYQAEAAGKRAEQSREQAVTAQLQAEDAKFQAEEARKQSENAKRESEAARAQAESSRRKAASEQLKAASARKMAEQEKRKADEARLLALKEERKAAVTQRHNRDLMLGIKHLVQEYQHTIDIDDQQSTELLKGMTQLGTRSNNATNVYYEKVQLNLHLRREPGDLLRWRQLGLLHLVGYDFKLAEDCFVKASAKDSRCLRLIEIIKPLSDRNVTMATIQRGDLLPLFRSELVRHSWPWLLNRILINELEKKQPDDALYDLVEAYLQISDPDLKLNYKLIKRGYRVSFSEMPSYLEFRLIAFAQMRMHHLAIGPTNFPVGNAMQGVKAKEVDLTQSNIRNVNKLAKNKSVRKIYLKPDQIEVGMAQLLASRKEVYDEHGQRILKVQ